MSRGNSSTEVLGASSSPALPYLNITPLHRGRRHTLVRATHGARTIVIKQPAAEPPAPSAIASLRHEYEILRELNAPGIVRAVDLVPISGGLGLVVDDAGPRDFAHWIDAGCPSMSDFFEISIQLADIVARVHEARIVHRDLNPSNLIWDAEARRLTLVDFGIATTLSGLTVETTGPSQLEGTLGYISPEQTGRTGRSVDSRSDLYSLGATLYELLVGAPPFGSGDPVALVHAHLARRPNGPHEVNADVPRALSNIVLMLLEKEPERRYQTADALASDLREASRQWSRSQTIAPFPLADHDVPRDLAIADKLYGRATEIRTLEHAFARASTGGRELVLVAGAPGIGKSALVNHLERSAIEHRGRYIAGKFDQLQRSVPFSGLASAFRALVRQLLTEPRVTLASWRDRIQAAVTPNGQVLIEVVPELARILGPQPTVAELGPVEAKNRLNLVVTAFLRAFARPDHPLALFLDDLQWIDAASLQLLEHWIRDVKSKHLLLIGAYRDTEVEASHPLARSLGELRAAGTKVHEIQLGPIGVDDVAQLIGDAFSQDATRTRPLAELVVRKTAGNPFFVRRLLHQLHADQLIRFEPRTRTWHWDVAELESAPVSDNVLDLMTQAIDRLPQPTRTLLQLGACIGHRFDLGTVAEVSGLPRTTATDQLWPALEDGLLLPLRDTYKAPRRAGPMETSLDELPAVVQFVHDRVQQAAYALSSDQQRRALHLGIGRRLLRKASHGQLDEQLFEIVDQLDLGEALVVEPAERLRLADLNLAAGRKAKASAAYQAAFNYLSVGLRLLPSQPWDDHGELCFALHRELAECAYLTARHAMADALVEAALEHAPSKAARADLYTLRALAAMVAGDSARALRVGRDGLALFGLAWPLETIDAAIEAEAASVTMNLKGRRIEDLVHEPEVVDDEIRACMRLFSILGPPAYFSGANDVLAFVTMTSTNLSLRHGPSPYSSYAYVFYGALHQARTGDYDTGYAFGRLAVDLAHRFGNRGEQSRTVQVFSLIVSPWKAPLRATLPLLREGYRAAIESGELAYAGFTLSGLLINSLPAAVPLPELLGEATAGLEFVTRHDNQIGISIKLPFQQLVRSLTGVTSCPGNFDDHEFQEASFLQQAAGNDTALGHYWVLRLQAAYLAGDYALARQCSERAVSALPGILGMFTSVEHVFYSALTLAAAYDDASSAEQPRLLGEIAASCAKLAQWAERCPENFRHKEQLVGAELARLTGSAIDAMKLYRAAIEAAGREGFIQDEALGHELRGRFLIAEGESRVAKGHFAAARDGYRSWGATMKVEALERTHPELATPDAPHDPVRRDVGLDTLGLLKASQAISAETVPARLFERILRIAVEVAGGQRGALLLGDPDALTVRARVNLEDGAEIALDELPLDDCPDLPRSIIRYVARLEDPLVLADAASDERFASYSVVRDQQIRSVLCLPLQKQAQLVGILYLENDAIVGAFTPERVDVIQVLAAQALISLQNSALLAERDRAERTSRFLADAGAALVESLDYGATIARVVRLAVPTFADWCLLDLIGDDGKLHRAELAYADPTDAALANQLKRFRVGATVINEIPPTGALVERVTTLAGTPVGGSAGEVLMIEHIAPRSLISAPLVARGRTLGILTFIVARSGRSYDRDDLAVAQELAKRCALAMDNAILYKEAQQAIQLRDEFLAIASHELKTPLTPLQLQLHTLGRRLNQLVADSESAEWFQQRLGVLNRQSERLERLVNELLDISRIAGGRLRLELEPVELNEVVRQVIRQFEETGETARSGSTISVEFAATALGRWDRLRIEQVVTNLISNALKYGQGKPIAIAVTRTSSTATLSVTDEGIGIDPAHLDRIFGRFERAVSARQYGGLGLGLYIGNQVVEAMGGTIAVRSTPGEGSTFTVTLPLAGPPHRSAA
ncbi:MAG: AAA family ATPase [Kofleriaceae bacterium]